MGTTHHIQNNFTAGELSPKMYGRSDFERQANGVKTLLNALPLPHGPVIRRNGTQYIATVKDSAKLARLIPFEFSTTQAYVIEMGDLYFRFFMNDGQIAVIDSYTKLLLHCDGDNTSTTFTDDGDTGHTVTTYNHAKISTDQSKFGGASLVCDGLMDRLTIPDHADWDFGVGELCIDMWVRFNTTTKKAVLWTQASGTDYITFIQSSPDNTLTFAVMSSGSRLVLESGTWAPSADTWYHVAVIRGWGGGADDWAITVDGAAIATFTASVTMPDLAADAWIGTEQGVLIDYGATGHALTLSGAFISTLSASIGRGSLFFDGTDDYVSIPDHADWDIVGSNSDNWTISLFVDHTDHAGQETYISQYVDGTHFWRLVHTDGSGLQLLVFDGVQIINLYGGEISDTSWHHVVLCKVADEYGLYLDGVQTAYAQVSSVATFAATLEIGRSGAGGNHFAGKLTEINIEQDNIFSASPNNGNTDTITVPVAPHSPTANTKVLLHCDNGDHDGFIDEIRVSKGASRWSATFTPETVAYPLSLSSASGGSIYEVAHTYTESQLAFVKYTQSADTLYLVHPNHAPATLSRTAHDAWTLSDITLTDGPYLDENSTATTLTPSAATGTVTITASAITGINDGAGFKSTDVGRILSIKHTTWGVAKITVFTDTLNVTAVTSTDFGGTTAVTAWKLGAWSDTTGWPSAVMFIDDRLGFASNANQPQTIWLSQVGDYSNFGISDPLVDSDAVTKTIAASQVNVIRWMAPTRNLLLGTSGAEWSLKGDTEAGFTPTAAQAWLETNEGSANVAPLILGNKVLFLQQLGKKLIEFQYLFDIDGYNTKDLSLLARHLSVSTTITELEYQKNPNPTVWAVRSDGVLLGMTYLPTQDVIGWHRHATGTSDKFESIAVITGTDRDEVWVLVKRTINGSTARYVERFNSEFTDTTATNGFFVDSGLTYDGTAATTISGLDHLEGESVSILADGVVVTGKTVSSGSITLDSSASVVHIGIGYNSDVETLDVNPQVRGGSSQGRTRSIVRVTTKVYRSGPVQIGTDSSNLQTETKATAPALYTGDVQVDFPEGWEQEASVFIRQSQPLPLTVDAIITEIDISGR